MGNEPIDMEKTDESEARADTRPVASSAKTEIAGDAAPAGETAIAGDAPGINAVDADADDVADATDPVFAAEQEHLTRTYNTIAKMASDLARKMEATSEAAAADKLALVSEISNNFASDTETLETAVDYAVVNSVIDAYNAAQSTAADKLARCRTLLRQPYFAKVVLQFSPTAEPKELYIGAAGVSDDNYKRLVVDWRSPVAETYYNQESGPTSYVANGREIHVDLKLRRQFDIAGSRLNAYFDTTVAIQDALLLESLSQRRSAKMKAITATIQREQNEVVRHDDVEALIVAGIAGSGKTSVMLQRIAYLLYRQRGALDASEVYLITPNPVFRRYIDDVLPDMGERNPETLTWEEFAAGCMPPDRAAERPNTPVEALWRIDAAASRLEFEDADFRDIEHGGVKLLTANQIRSACAKFRNAAAGPHRVTLMREELLERLDARVKQLASTDTVLDELGAMSLDDQLAAFGEPYTPTNEEEARGFARRLLADRYAPAFAAVERDEWLRIDRIGMRLLGAKSLSALEWAYLKMAVTGMGDADAKYVMVDEVQDYTPAQLAVLARWFRRAHFLLLGDERQAIQLNGSTFAQAEDVFARLRGEVSRCSLLTSYRSSPQITALFARLLPAEARMRISSVQRESEPPRIETFATEEAWGDALRDAVERALRENDGLTAIVVPWKHEAKRLAAALAPLGDAAPSLVDDGDALPAGGVVAITLQLAKGLEFDHVIVPDASPRVFPADDAVARNRLYTTISRATRTVEVYALGELTPLLGR